MGGAKVIISTAPNSKAIADIINGLGFDGQLIIVSAPGEPMMIAPGQCYGEGIRYRDGLPDPLETNLKMLLISVSYRSFTGN